MYSKAYTLHVTHRKNMHSKYACIACYKQEKRPQWNITASPTGNVKKSPPKLRASFSQYTNKTTTPFQKAITKKSSSATIICMYCSVVNKTYANVCINTHTRRPGKGKGRNSISRCTTFISTTSHGSLHNRIPREKGGWGRGNPHLDGYWQ